MNVASQYEKIGKLRALAEHPDTPPAEAFSARRRMDEIEAKIRNESAKRQQEQAAKVMENVRPSHYSGTAAFKKLSQIRKKPRIKFPVDWPFGWDGRESVEVEVLYFDSDKKIVLGWECPSCKMRVERTITQRHRARLMGKKGGVDNFIQGVREGVINQLCDACWKENQ